MGRVIFILSLWTVGASAKFVGVETATVPIERLIKNLSELSKKSPRNPRPQFALGRLHAMAYARKTYKVEIRKRELASPKPTEAWFGHQPKRIPFTVKKTGDKAQNERAQIHLKQAIAHYIKAVELNPSFHAAQLGLGWCLDQAGNKKSAKEHYTKALDGAYAIEKNMKRGFGWNWSIAVEASEYLLPLLNKKTDAKERARIKGQVAKIKRIPRAITPILIPLTQETRLEALLSKKRVRFDLDGSGEKRLWQWPNAKAGWLVHDPQRTGRITSGLQLFGQVTFWLFWDHGYEAMAALDDNQDGRLFGHELKGLAVWCDKNQNGVSDPGEVQSLKQVGIQAIRTDFQQHATGILYHPQGVQLGASTRPTYDWIAESDPQ